MQINVQVIGIDSLKIKYNAKKSDVKKQMKTAMGLACLKLMAEIRQTISSMGEPDDFPRRVTGNLLQSIRIGTYKEEGNNLSQTVGANPDGTEIGYANFLEFGTSKMKARPFITFVAEKEKDFVMKQLQEGLRKIC